MPSEFRAAGILFTDGVHVLAGYQPSKASISGFGGSRERGESIRQTAIREAIEELLEPSSDIQFLLQVLVIRYKESPAVRKGSYRFLILSFEDLLRMLQEAKAAGIKSTLYKSIPTTIAALLNKRTPTLLSEVTELMLLPAKTTGLSGLDPQFAEDIASVM